MGSKRKASATRQALRRLAQRLPQLVEAAMGVRGEVMAGSVSRTSKVCGKPNCKCARGEKHVVYQISWSDEGGKRHSAHIRADEIAKIKAGVSRYRHLRQCRAELLKAASEGAKLIDALVEELSIPAPKKGRGAPGDREQK
jgi:hypothetical protein